MRLEGYNFIIARPGFNKKYNREVSWQELIDTFTLYKRIPMVVAGGDHSGPIDPNKAIGFVDAKIDESAQIIRGLPEFSEKRFMELPAEIQRRLRNREHVPASLGYVQFENLRKVDHIAIGVDSPVFPDVGFNAEDNFWYEETEGMSSKEQKKPDEPVKYITKEDFDKFASQMVELLKAKEAPPEPSPEKTAAKDVPTNETEAPLAEELPTPQPTPVVEPERVIPKGTSKASSDGWLLDEHGRRYLSYPVAGREATRRGEKT